MRCALPCPSRLTFWGSVGDTTLPHHLLFTMNTEPKILLTINLEGGILLKGEPEVKKYYLTKKDLFPSQKFKGDAGKKVIRSGKYVHIPMVQSEAKQKITLCREAYDYMTSSLCPIWFKNHNQWKKLDEKARLELHLARTSRHFGGKSFTYQLIDDE